MGKDAGWGQGAGDTDCNLIKGRAGMGQNGDTKFPLSPIHPCSLSLGRTSGEQHRKHKLLFVGGCAADLLGSLEWLAQHLMGLLGSQ